MGTKSRFRPTSTAYDSKLITPTQFDDTQKVSFNFKCLNSKGNKFKYQEQEKAYFNKLLDRLRDLSRMTRKDLMTSSLSHSKSLRCHPINFKDTTETSFGLPDKQDLYSDAWQFEITANQYGRVHGYFVGNVFYIVWFDPEHELYPSPKK